jgi:tetratricopeptide (TPR) repeat protein
MTTFSAEKGDRHLPLDQLPFTQPMQWVSYGKEREKAKQYDEAITIYDQGLIHYPDDFRLWHERGLALAKLQRFEEALVSYDRAQQLRPGQRDLEHERGDTLLQLGRYEEAVAAFDVYLRYSPGTTHILADRGYALCELGRYEEALRSLNAVLKTGQQDRVSLRQAYYYQIEALRQLGQFEAALCASEKAVKLYPGESFQSQQDRLRRQMSRLDASER